jgi:hypothetical protein
MIRLPFPPGSLSGHAKGNHFAKSRVTKQWRGWAWVATMEAKPVVPETGDIVVRVRFVPPDNRSDRTNFANRMKPIFDGIAQALGVNDKRFVPAYDYAEPCAPGWIEVTL